MMNHIKYALSKYSFWLSLFATVIGIIAIFPICKYMAIIVIFSCFTLAFIIPFIVSFVKRNFKVKSIGKSNITFTFGDLFDEECFVITTNRYFDVNPTGEYIAEDSLLGKFAKKYFQDNVSELEKLINEKLAETHNDSAPFQYGTNVKIQFKGRTIYFMAFTDRNKKDQPEDFYIQSIQTFFKNIINENHGKTIAIPLFGDNNNLSDSGFSNSEIAFKSLMSMINSFEMVNQRSELKLKIVALPEKRSELINLVSSYFK